MKIRSHNQDSSAFTLIELLVVIAIMGILAAIAVPSIKNISKGQATATASRQMLDDIARARQLAIAHRTTVYMVFVPANFWNNNSYNGNANAWATLTSGPTGPVEMEKARTLLDRQNAAYTFVSLRSVGDQPGQGNIQYLSAWKTLPDGTMIASNKFAAVPYPTLVDTIDTYPVYNFPVTNLFPFPSEESPFFPADPSMQPRFWLPYLAFNYLGQLESGRDEFIPLARGSVGYGRNADKQPNYSSTSIPREDPINNSTTTYNIIRIDWVTGRARVLQPQIQ